jgi:hypothetical protein
MSEISGVRYARSGDVSVAYQVISGIDFSDRGIHELKGVPDAWQLFAVSA